MKVIASLQDLELTTLEDRINLDEIDSLIYNQLDKAGIDLLYDFGIIDAHDSLRLVRG